jgi:hypothetical protein
MATPEDRLREAAVATALGDEVPPDPEAQWLSRLSDATLLVMAVVAHGHGVSARDVRRSTGRWLLGVMRSLHELERFRLAERKHRPGPDYWFATAIGTRLSVTPYVCRLLDAAKPFWTGDPYGGWSIGAFNKIGTEHGPPIFRPSVALADVNDVDALANVLRTGLRDDRAFALTKLIALKDPRSAGVLRDVAQTHGEDELLARRAVIALASFGDPATIAMLIDTCAHRDSLMREAAAHSLGVLRAGEAVPALIELIAYESAPVRVAAVVALEQIGDPSALAAVETALGDQDSQVRHCARHTARHLRAAAR